MAARGRPQKKPGKAKIRPAVTETTNTGKSTPKFCFAHLDTNYCLDQLDQGKRASVAMAMQLRCRMTWNQLITSGRHGLGSELIPVGQIRPSLPPTFADEDKVMVFRYDGLLPMIGIRVGDTFHVLWVERSFGDVYSHG